VLEKVLQQHVHVVVLQVHQVHQLVLLPNVQEVVHHVLEEVQHVQVLMHHEQDGVVVHHVQVVVHQVLVQVHVHGVVHSGLVLDVLEVGPQVVPYVQQLEVPMHLVVQHVPVR